MHRTVQIWILFIFTLFFTASLFICSSDSATSFLNNQAQNNHTVPFTFPDQDQSQGILYKIKNYYHTRHSVLTTSSTLNGADVYARAESPFDKRQYWKIIPQKQGYISLHLKGSNKCLDIDYGKNSNGSYINLRKEERDAPRQLWKLERDTSRGCYVLRSKLDLSKVVRGLFGNIPYTLKVQLQSSMFSHKEKYWDIIQISGANPFSAKYYYIVESIGDNAVEVQDASKESGANVRLGNRNGAENQKWQIEHAGFGYYRIICKGSRKCLDIANEQSEIGTNIQQWTKNNSDAQLWEIVSLTKDTYRITSKLQHFVASRLCVGTGTENKNHANVYVNQWHDGSGKEYQKWKIIPAE